MSQKLQAVYRQLGSCRAVGADRTVLARASVDAVERGLVVYGLSWAAGLSVFERAAGLEIRGC